MEGDGREMGWRERGRGRWKKTSREIRWRQIGRWKEHRRQMVWRDRQIHRHTDKQTEAETERGWCRELRKLGQQQNAPHGLAEPPRPMELSGPVILVAVNQDEAERWTRASW